MSIWMIVIIYALFMVSVGYISYLKETREGFLLGNRSLSGSRLGFSLSASFFGGGMLTATTAIAYEKGLGVVSLYIGVILGFLILAVFAGKMKSLADKEQFYSITDFIYYLYGAKSAVITSIMFLLIYIGVLVLQFMVGANVLEKAFNWGHANSIMIMGGITLSYMILGGFKSMINTDVMQYMLIIVTGIFILLFGELSFDSFRLSVAESSHEGIPADWVSIMFMCCYVIAAADHWQRIYSAKSVSEAKKALGWASVFMIILGTVVAIIGMAVKVKFPDINPEDTLVYGLNELLPVWLAPMSLLILFSITMSSADTCIFTASTTLINDLLPRVKGQKLQVNIRLAMRITMLIVTAIGILLAIFATGILSAMYTLVSLMLCLSALIFFSLLGWKIRNFFAVLSIIIPFIVLLYLVYTGGITEKNMLYSVLAGVLVIFTDRVLQLFMKKASS